jgi:hypothetical protein
MMKIALAMSLLGIGGSVYAAPRVGSVKTATTLIKDALAAPRAPSGTDLNQNGSRLLSSAKRTPGSNNFAATTKAPTVAIVALKNASGRTLFNAGATVPKGTVLQIKADKEPGPGGVQTNYGDVSIR